MKRLSAFLPLLVLIVAMLPQATASALDEGEFTVTYDSVELDPDTWYEYEFSTEEWYKELRFWANTDELTVSFYVLVEYNIIGSTGPSGSATLRWSAADMSGLASMSGEVMGGDDVGYSWSAATGYRTLYSYGSSAAINISSMQYFVVEITSGLNSPDYMALIHSLGLLGIGSDATGTYRIMYGVLTAQYDCDTLYSIQEYLVDDGTIDATDEDGEYTEITTGNLYRLEVWGGPWNDSIDDRYDTAISFDGEEWIPFTDFLIDGECFDIDDEHPEMGTVFFISPSDDFYIRVNDEAEEFADNSGEMSYSLALATQLTELKCTDQFTWDGEEGEPMASYTVYGGQAAGVEITDLEIGEWYVYVTQPGPWYNAGSERYDMAIKNTVGIWDAIADYEMLECQEDAIDPLYTRYFFQAWGESLWTRVNDTDGIWSHNTGSMGVEIYAATYHRFLDACEGTYLVGDLVISKNFYGNQSGGVNVGTYDHFNNIPRGGGEGPIEVLRYYVLDTLDGPWFDSGAPLYTTQLRKELEGDWYETIIHPEMDCVAETDLLGHARGYFDMDKPYEYYIRVNETTTWTDNTGQMRYNLYEATNGQIGDPDDPPEPGYCDDFYTRGDQLGQITFQATNQTGAYVPGVTEYGEIYSIVTTGGPWDDGTSPDLYDVAISDDDGATWYTLAEYPGMLCKQLEGEDYVEVFIQHVRGRRWKVRVDDTVFHDNSGTMGIKVYGVESDIDPWHTCSDDYDLVEVQVPDNDIAAWYSGGSFVPYIGPNSSYIWAIEITDGPWQDDDTDMYTAEIYDGTDWYNHNSYGICTEQVGASNEYFRTYFSPTGSSYKLRADDQDDDFFNNSGSFKYRLYKAYAVDPDDPDDPDDPYIPPDWDLNCTTPCYRPSYYFKSVTINFWELGSINLPIPAVDDWLEYSRCGITKYISWCPEHTAALQAIPLRIRNREPFRSFMVLTDLSDAISDDLNSFEWTTDTAPSAILYALGGGEAEDYVQFDLIPDMADSPWDGGQITYGEGGAMPGGGEGWDLDCPTEMKDAAASAFGVDSDSPLIKSYCFAVRTPFILKAYWMYLTVSVELAFIVLLIRYLYKKIQQLL